MWYVVTFSIFLHLRKIAVCHSTLSTFWWKRLDDLAKKLHLCKSSVSVYFDWEHGMAKGGLRPSLILCCSRSNARGKGPQRAPCQLKKAFKSPRQRRLLGGIVENSITLRRDHWFAVHANQWFSYLSGPPNIDCLQPSWLRDCGAYRFYFVLLYLSSKSCEEKRCQKKIYQNVILRSHYIVKAE